MCVKIGGGKAIIKAGRLEPHPIQRRGQRFGEPSIFWWGNLDQAGMGNFFSENCNKNIFHCHLARNMRHISNLNASNCVFLVSDTFYQRRHMTGFKLMVTLQSGCVPEIMTLCRIDVIFSKNTM